MKLKSLIVTIAILAALSVVAFFARRPAPAASADTRVGRPLLDTAQAEKATAFKLTDQGKTVALARNPDGSWRVSSFHDLPADFAKLTRLVGELSEAKLIRLVSSRADVISRLEFKDTTLTLLDGDKPLWSATLGKNADTGGRYVRFNDEQKAYLASLNTWLDADPKSWADTALPTLKADDIAKIEIPFADAAPLVLTRAQKEDTWTSATTPAGQRVSDSKLASVLSSLTTLRFSDTSNPSDEKAAAAQKHLRTLQLTTFTGTTCSIALGRQPEEKKLKLPVADASAIPDFTKNSPVAPDGSVKPIEPAKPAAPEFETIPAGPVFAFIASSDVKAVINELMKKRAYQLSDYVFTSLPQTPAELFEPTPVDAKPAPEKAP